MEWIKVNTDVVVGVARICSVLEVELWGPFEGVKLAWEKGVKKIALEMDFIDAINLLSGQTRDQNLLSGKVRNLLERMEEFRVIHVSR
ncbi:hypothetical protein J1N35_017893 [Gossypium stocksii]|uniref:RNase H type-1 domain-containing protein n=1 Tax=Gossypium stocksii TaxID=47602 RepID=A0A9D3VMZ2_9ROSI|nr:hypothetical protein J1N35_017893 [Gossypium stocksii]